MVRRWILCATCSRPGLLTLKSGRLSTCSGTRAHPQIGKSCQWWSTLRAMHSSLSVCTHWLFNISFLIDYFILYVIQIFIDLLVSKQTNEKINFYLNSISVESLFIWNFFKSSEQSRKNKNYPVFILKNKAFIYNNNF